MDITKVYTIVCIVIAIASFCYSMFTLILSKVKKKAEANNDEEMKSKIESLEGDLALIEELVPAAIEKAEQTGLAGELKDLIAKAQIQLACGEKGIKYDANQINDLIKDIVAFTKKIN